MQSVGFNTLPFSVPRKIAVTFSAQFNPPLLPQGPQSDEVHFGVNKDYYGKLRNQAKYIKRLNPAIEKKAKDELSRGYSGDTKYKKILELFLLTSPTEAQKAKLDKITGSRPASPRAGRNSGNSRFAGHHISSYLASSKILSGTNR